MTTEVARPSLHARVVPPPASGTAGRRTMASTMAAWALLAACSSPVVADPPRLPGRPADLHATVAGEPGSLHLVDTAPVRDGAWRGASDGYFEGMPLSGPLTGDDPVVVAGDGGALTSSDVAPGDVVEVWLGEMCGESAPVQCEVLAIRVAAHAG